MELLVHGYRRARVIRLAAGLIALFVLVARVCEGGHTAADETANAFIWATACLATALLVWRERNQAVVQRRSSEANAHFMAAAETSQDAFLILDPVKNAAGDLVDFRYRYVNSHAEKVLQTPRNKLLNQEMCALFQ
jgi:PAS domain-containing protein